MTGEITCIWTSGTARELFERYERHLAEIHEMMAVPAAMQASHPRLGDTADELCARIKDEMTRLVSQFTVPAAIIISAPVTSEEESK